jgi:hypothetical protein
MQGSGRTPYRRRNRYKNDSRLSSETTHARRQWSGLCDMIKGRRKTYNLKLSKPTFKVIISFCLDIWQY